MDRKNATLGQWWRRTWQINPSSGEESYLHFKFLLMVNVMVLRHYHSLYFNLFVYLLCQAICQLSFIHYSQTSDFAFVLIFSSTHSYYQLYFTKRIAPHVVCVECVVLTKCTLICRGYPSPWQLRHWWVYLLETECHLHFPFTNFCRFSFDSAFCLCCCCLYHFSINFINTLIDCRTWR